MLNNVGFHRPFQPQPKLPFGIITVKTDRFVYSDPYTRKTNPKCLKKLQEEHNKLKSCPDLNVSEIKEVEEYCRDEHGTILLDNEKSDVLISDHSKKRDKKNEEHLPILLRGGHDLENDYTMLDKNGNVKRVIYGDFSKIYTHHEFEVEVKDKQEFKNGTDEQRLKELDSYAERELKISKNLDDALRDDASINIFMSKEHRELFCKQ